jgi:DNA-binding transcriptional MerR regulator
VSGGGGTGQGRCRLLLTRLKLRIRFEAMKLQKGKPEWEGPLWPASDRGFSTSAVARYTGVKEKAIVNLAERRIVVPEIMGPSGSGSRRMYSPRNIIQVGVVSMITSLGLPSSICRVALSQLDDAGFYAQPRWKRFALVISSNPFVEFVYGIVEKGVVTNRGNLTGFRPGGFLDMRVVETDPKRKLIDQLREAWGKDSSSRPKRKASSSSVREFSGHEKTMIRESFDHLGLEMPVAVVMRMDQVVRFIEVRAYGDALRDVKL